MFLMTGAAMAKYLWAFQILQLTAVSSMSILSAEVKHNPKYVENLTAVLRNEQLFLDTITIRTLLPGLNCHVAFDQRPKGNGSNYHTVFKFTINVCNALQETRLSIFKRWYVSLGKYGNLLSKCPVRPGHYYVHGWSLDLMERPLILQAGYYRMIVHFFYGKLNSKSEDLVGRGELDVFMK